MSKITDRIEEMLKFQGLSKKEMLDSVGVTASAYSQWKLGQSQPRLERLYLISEYLHIPVACLFEETKTAATQTDDGLSQNQKRLIQLVSSLDDDLCAYLIQKAQDLIDFQQFRDARQ